MAVVSVWCYDSGIASDCWDTVTTAIANRPTAQGGPLVAFRQAYWDTVARILTYTRSGDIARLYRHLIAPGVTLTDNANVTVGGSPTTALSVVRSDAAWVAL